MCMELCNSRLFERVVQQHGKQSRCRRASCFPPGVAARYPQITRAGVSPKEFAMRNTVIVRNNETAMILLPYQKGGANSIVILAQDGAMKTIYEGVVSGAKFAARTKSGTLGYLKALLSANEAYQRFIATPGLDSLYRADKAWELMRELGKKATAAFKYPDQLAFVAKCLAAGTAQPWHQDFVLVSKQVLLRLAEADTKVDRAIDMLGQELAAALRRIAASYVPTV